MIIEYVCSACKNSLVDVELVIRRKCETCGEELEQFEWDPLAED